MLTAAMTPKGGGEGGVPFFFLLLLLLMGLLFVLSFSFPFSSFFLFEK
jgi:lipopolysaccharide export LptBFGC system permease protein LptF